VTILGRNVGDRLTIWSEGGRGCLPNGKLCFHYATAKHDYAHACTPWQDCYWKDWLYPARIDTVAPDEVIETDFSDCLAGRDPVFEGALALAARLP